jgi:predicted dehydrogenase
MSSTHNVGVIGYGWAATAHIEAINNTTQGNVTAVYSSRELDPAKLSAAHGGEIKVYNKIEDLLADDSIDVVDITSYPTQHKDQAIAAAKAGKAVILEKPITLNLEDAEAIKAAFDANNTMSCVCFELRFISQFTTIKAILDEGLIGEVHYGEVDYYHGIGPWYGQYRWNTTVENGGSSLLSAGCHALDALLLYMGSEVEEVTAYNAQSKHEIFAKYEYPTTTTVLLKFKSGAVGKCASVIDCFMPYYFHTQLCGSEGSILDNKLYSSKLHLRDKAWTELPVALADSGDVADHPYQDQFQAFFDALDKDEAMPLTSYDDAFDTFRVLFAADQSAAEGRSVKLGGS